MDVSDYKPRTWQGRFKVSGLQSFKNSFNVSLENIDPILPNVHFMVSYRYLYSIVNMFKPFKDGSSRCLGAHLLHVLKFVDAPFLRFPKQKCFERDFGLSLIFLSISVFPEINNIGVGSHGHIR